MSAYYYKLSADQGNALSQYNYGFCLREGEGVEQDFRMAAYYFKLSADQGHALSQFCYGVCLAKGEGVEQDFRMSAYYFKLSADQGNAWGQSSYGFCLHTRVWSENDLELSVKFFKLAADQGNAHGQYNYGFCLEHGHGIGQDLKMASHYYKLSADQGDPYGQCYYGLCLEHGQGVDIDLNMAASYYKHAADEHDSHKQRLCPFHLLRFDVTKFSAESPQYIKLSTAHAKSTAQLRLANFLENGIGISKDHILAAKYYEMASDLFPSACACYGWCLQHGRGVPVNLTEAAAFFQYAADGDNADGANSLGICLERGLGIEKDIDRSVLYYRKAASQQHPAGMNNFGRCLESGQGIDCDPIRAAKYYRLAAELKNADAMNNFGICLERGIGVHANQELAAEYYRNAADEGHSDGANNFGFCLEHGRGVQQNIELAVKYYKQAVDGDHSEAAQNYRRCLRLLGRWSILDRSSNVSEQKPSFEEKRQIEKRKFDGLLTGFRRSNSSMNFEDEWTIGQEIGKGDFSVVHLAQNKNRTLNRAVKTVNSRTNNRYFERESSIHRKFDHPLIVGFEQYIPATQHQRAMIVTEFVPNGSLSDYLSSAGNSKEIVGAGGTRIAMIVVGIVLAMRYLHSCGFIHGDLKPEHILLDWDWIVRICAFCRSVLSEASDAELDDNRGQLSCNERYSVPECFYNEQTLNSDVFSFGLILYELLTGKPVFSPELGHSLVMKKIVLEGAHPYIPDSVAPKVKSLIEDCLNYEWYERPSFDTILFRLDEIGFQITRGVNSRKIRQFVTAVKDREKELGIDL
jgi:TPR repeat protein